MIVELRNQKRWCKIFCILLILLNACSNEATESVEKNGPKWDENGYVFFCLCMGKKIVGGYLIFEKFQK